MSGRGKRENKTMRCTVPLGGTIIIIHVCITSMSECPVGCKTEAEGGGYGGEQDGAVWGDTLNGNVCGGGVEALGMIGGDEW